MEQKNLPYKNSPRWNMLIEDGKLLITKGADEIYLIEDIADKEAEMLYEVYKNESIHKLKSSTTDEKILGVISKLDKTGVIYKSTESVLPPKTINFSVSWIGNSDQRILDLLEKFTKNSKQLTFNANAKLSDLLIVVRTSAKLAETMIGYEKIKSPHIFVDIAYDHTLSLGPLVFPGETACLGCFVGRITRNWGDAKPPIVSNVRDSSELIASLILEQIRTFQKTGSCQELIEKAWTFNLADLTTKIDNIFRLPWCPICYPDKPKEGLGSFELPWKLKANQV